MKTRFLFLSKPIQNFDSFCEWMKVSPNNSFNFKSQAKNQPELKIVCFE